jgi:uncharacterized protein (TIGR00369 family)
MTRLTADELNEFFTRAFPGTTPAVIETVGPRSARLRLKFQTSHLRPGGTISGPSLMALADTAMYAALLAQIGLVPLAVTTNLNINFLSKPPQKDVIALVEIVKLGARLAVGDVRMLSDGETELVAQANVTYSIPPKHL